MAITISGSGTITGLSAGGLPSGSVTSDTIANGSVAAGDLASTLDLTGKTVTLPSGTGGKVLQVVQAVKTDALALGTSGFTTITNFNATITPISTSNKVMVHVMFGGQDASGGGIAYRLVRNGSVITGAIGDAAGSRDRATSRTTAVMDNNHTVPAPHIAYLDSPASSSAQTYSLQVRIEGDGTYYFNRSQVDTDIANAYGARTIGAIILMEIAA